MRILVIWNSTVTIVENTFMTERHSPRNSSRPRDATSEKFIRETCKVDPARSGCEAFGFGEPPAKFDVIAFSRATVFRGDSRSSELHSRKIAAS